VEEMSIGEFARRSRLSPKALRLYDGRGLLSPARVDELSGYRYYEDAQLHQARLIATLRHVGVPLTTVEELLELDPAELAEQLTAFWRHAESRHAGQRKLVTALVDRLTGRNTVMYEVNARELPQRSLLTLKRNVDVSGLWAFGKEFMALMRDQRLPRMEGREEPAHREAYVDLGPGGQIDEAQWQLADEALRSWRDAQGIEDKQLTLTPEDLGVRITYLATPPVTETSVPDCDFAVPFA
jgi:DNA-binding transcriptional MerR regulator